MSTEMVEVRYVGTKPLKTDTVTRSLAVWPGNGRTCLVPADVAALLFAHPDVWVPADQAAIVRPVVEAIEPVDEEEEEEAVDALDVEDVGPGEGPVTIFEIVEMLPSLDKETDFTETGKPIVGKVRDRFPDREVSLAAVRRAWDEFSGA